MAPTPTYKPVRYATHTGERAFATWIPPTWGSHNTTFDVHCAMLRQATTPLLDTELLCKRLTEFSTLLAFGIPYTVKQERALLDQIADLTKPGLCPIGTRRRNLLADLLGHILAAQASRLKAQGAPAPEAERELGDHFTVDDNLDPVSLIRGGIDGILVEGSADHGVARCVAITTEVAQRQGWTYMDWNTFLHELQRVLPLDAPELTICPKGN